LPKVTGKTVYKNQQQQAELSDSCEALQQLGSVKSLLQKIKSDMSRIHKMMDEPDLQSIEKDVRRLAKRVHENSVTLIQIIDSDFSKVTLTQKIRWSVKAEKSHWQIHRAWVEKAYNWSGPAPEILQSLEINSGDHSVEVTLERPASLVEVCQLQKTLVLFLNLEFKSGQRIQVAQYRLDARDVERL
jgi:Zn-dependent M32 family carboxypeptidase